MKIDGEITLPGDKSISHRSLIFGALTSGTSKLFNLSDGEDVKSTMSCLKDCNVKIVEKKNYTTVNGKEFSKPNKALHCGNSGTTARLLAGFLANRKIDATLVGDKSLSKRPMHRIIKPLREMGSIIESNDNFLPIKIKANTLHGIDYQSQISSAQLKSCILIASLTANTKTAFTEPYLSRNHTELFLKSLGAKIYTKKNRVEIMPFQKLNAFDIEIPSDISSASFFITAALLMPDSKLYFKNILLNETRLGFVKILKKNGADISTSTEKIVHGEKVGNLTINYSTIKPFKINKEKIPSMIDEIPLLAILATKAKGITIVRGAKELRYKECDRIKAICQNLKRMNAKVKELEDGFIIEGPSDLEPRKIHTFNDHRIAMAFTILNKSLNGTYNLDNTNCIKISYPNFIKDMNSLMQ